MDQIPCPDGYLLDAKSPVAEGHHALNDYLMRVEDAGWQTALKEINGNRDKGRKLVIWKALLERMTWLRDENPGSSATSPFRGLAERIEHWTLAPTEADLIELLHGTAEVATFLAPYTPMPHLIHYIDEHGLTLELAGAIRSFRQLVYDNCLQVSQTSIQLFRSRLDILAWRDEWTPIDPKRCWSERVRADYRAMQGEARENWRRFLYLIHGDETTRPSPKWSAAAEAAIEKIGREAFRKRMAEWLKPLHSGSVHKLSREGSFILRCFLWLADGELKPMTAEIAEVTFKPKANGEKVIRAAAEAAGLPDPTVPKAPVAPRMSDLVSRALSVVFAPGNATGLADRVEVGPELVHVRGNLDSYEIHIESGAIFRKSDGRQVKVASKGPTIGLPLPGMGAVMGILQDALALARDDSGVMVSEQQ